jgi:N-acetylglucosamine transport system permease protein
MAVTDLDTRTSTPPPVRVPPRRRGGGHVRRPPSVLTGLSHLALVVWAFTVIAPLLWTFLASFKTNTEIFSDPLALPHSFSFAAWGRAWQKAHVAQYLFNSVVVVTFSTAGTMLFGSMAAYVLSRYKFFGNRFLYTMFIAGLVFPVFLALVPLFFVVKNFGLLDTHLGLILVYIAYSLPFTVFFMSAFFRTLPTSVAEAAMIDGASHTRTFFQIMVPMAKPGLISITIFNVLGQWNQYLLPIVLVPSENKWVLTQGIANININAGYEVDYPGLFAALSMAIIPMIVVYVIFQRQIQSGLTAGAVK